LTTQASLEFPLPGNQSDNQPQAPVCPVAFLKRLIPRETIPRPRIGRSWSRQRTSLFRSSPAETGPIAKYNRRFEDCQSVRSAFLARRFDPRRCRPIRSAWRAENTVHIVTGGHLQRGGIEFCPATRLGTPHRGFGFLFPVPGPSFPGAPRVATERVASS